MGAVKNTREIAVLKAFHENIFFQDSSKADSFDAKLYYLLGKMEYYRILRDYEKVTLYSEKLFSLFDNNIKRFEDCASLYIYGLNIFIEGCHYMDRKQDVASALHKIQTMPSLIGKKNLTDEIQIEIFEIYYIAATDACLHFREYKKGVGYVSAIEEGIKKYDNRLTPSFKMILLQNVACLYFGEEKYKLSLKWCNLVLNNPPTSNREDVLCIAKILNLLIHLELRNNLILPYIIKSTYRFLYKKKRVYQFETLFLKYIKLFLKTDTKKEQVELLNFFKADLKTLENDQIENVIFNDIDLIGWIDKKAGKNFPFS